jgi:hypothetical protein
MPTEASESAAVTATRGRPRWHQIYFLLAAFDVITVSVSLLLGHLLVRIYTDSVRQKKSRPLPKLFSIFSLHLSQRLFRIRGYAAISTVLTLGRTHFAPGGTVMSRMRNRQRRLRTQRSYGVRLEQLEDRRAPGTMLAMIGSPFVALSYGFFGSAALAEDDARFSQTRDVDSLPAASDGPGAGPWIAACGLERSRLSPTSTEPSLNQTAIVRPAFDDLLVNRWNHDPLADLVAFEPWQHRPLVSNRGESSLGLPTGGESFSSELPPESNAGVLRPSIASQREAYFLPHDQGLPELLAGIIASATERSFQSRQDGPTCCACLGPTPGPPVKFKVPANSDAWVSPTSLDPTQNYYLFASGDVVVDTQAGTRADAEFYDLAGTQQDSVGGVNAGLEVDITTATPTKMVGSAPAVWGGYHPSHDYLVRLNGAGQLRIRFRDPDGNYSNNSDDYFSLELHICGFPRPIDLVPPESCEDSCGGGELIEAAEGAPRSPGAFASSSIRYHDGAPRLQRRDLASGGFGLPWGQTRTWSSPRYFFSPAWNGAGDVEAQLPYLWPYDFNLPIVISSASTARHFDASGENAWSARHYRPETIRYANSEYVLSDSTGKRLVFNDLDAGTSYYLRGQLKCVIEAGSTATGCTAGASGVTMVTRGQDGKVTEISRSTGSGPTKITDSYLYSYYAGTFAKGMTQTVTSRRGVGDPPSWTSRRRTSCSATSAPSS